MAFAYFADFSESLPVPVGKVSAGGMGNLLTPVKADDGVQGGDEEAREEDGATREGKKW